MSYRYKPKTPAGLPGQSRVNPVSDEDRSVAEAFVFHKEAHEGRKYRSTGNEIYPTRMSGGPYAAWHNGTILLRSGTSAATRAFLRKIEKDAGRNATSTSWVDRLLPEVLRGNPRGAVKRRNPTMSESQASTLLRQLGGLSKLTAMIGAKNFIRNVEPDGTPSLSFKFAGSKAANYARIALDASDTYTLRLFKIKGYDAVPVSSVSGLYADALRPAFERATGLYLSLGTMGRTNPRARAKRSNPLPGPAALDSLSVGDQFFVETDRLPGRLRPYTVIKKRYQNVTAEDDTNGAKVEIFEDSVDHDTLVMSSATGAARVVALRKKNPRARRATRSNPGFNLRQYARERRVEGGWPQEAEQEIFVALSRGFAAGARGASKPRAPKLDYLGQDAQRYVDEGYRVGKTVSSGVVARAVGRMSNERATEFLAQRGARQ